MARKIKGKSRYAVFDRFYDCFWSIVCDKLNGSPDDKVHSRYDDVFEILGNGDPAKGFILVTDSWREELEKHDNPTERIDLVGKWDELSDEQRKSLADALPNKDKKDASTKAQLERFFPNKPEVLQTILNGRGDKRPWKVGHVAQDAGNPDYQCAIVRISEDHEVEEVGLSVNPRLFAIDHRHELTRLVDEAIRHAKTRKF